MGETTVVNNTPQGKGFNPMMMVVIILLVILIAGAVIMANKKTSDESTETSEGQSLQTASPAPTNAMTETTGVVSNETATPEQTPMTDTKTINIEAGSYYFNPKVITVKKGQKVKVVMTSKDMMHDFNIDELNVHMSVTKAGSTSTVEFTADKVGSFEYYCSVGNHRSMGQVGTLTVE